MSERGYFDRDTNYTSESGFSRVKFGIDKPILEVELNEMQKIQEEKRTSIVKQTVPSGFSEIVKRDFDGKSIIYNPTITVRSEDEVRQFKKLNSIAIPPSKLVINGFEVDIEGNVEIDGIKGYTLIELEDKKIATNNSELYDFVFLELWFQEINSLTNLYKNGFLQGEILKNNIIDDRVGGETSRRVAIRSRIRVEKDINLKKWPNGFGYNSQTGEMSNIYARGPLSDIIREKEHIFLPATASFFKGTNFYNDFGLFVAGRKNYVNEKDESIINKRFGVLENYIFAVPMFGIKRRNQVEYSSSNPNGGIPYENENTISDRPDGLFNNLVDKKDLIDLRKSISFNQLNTVKLLDENLKKLMSGNLATSSNDKMTRVQFGLPQIDAINGDYLSNALLHLDFTNRNLTPILGDPPMTSGKNAKYHLSALGYGLSLDGEIVVKYPISTFNKSQGTIEFLLKPYWDGGDRNIKQTLFSITNELDLPLMRLSKDNGKLILKQFYNGSTTSLSAETSVDLNNETIYNNEIYHIRFSWFANNSESKTTIFINGKKVASGNYLLSELSPKFLRLGEIETINTYSSYFKGCLIDELVLYNKVLNENKFSQISPDITLGEAKIYNSFNSILRGFQDNEYKQSIISVIVTSNDTNTFNLESPYGTSINSENSKVYNSLTGKLYTGTWSPLEGGNARFDLTSTPDGTDKFMGETLWVTHEIVVPGGYGVKDVPTRILKAQLNDVDISFADYSNQIREVKELKNIESQLNFIQIKEQKAYDYSSVVRNDGTAFARLLKCTVHSNGTNVYRIPKELYGREVLGICNVNKKLSTTYKEPDGNFVVRLVDKLSFQDQFEVDIALGGFVFDYETHTKTLVSNMMKSKTIRIPTTGDTDEYVIPASLAINKNAVVAPNGGIVVSFLDLKQNNTTDLGKTVFVTGPVSNYLAKATVEGVGTPFIKIKFEETPMTDHFIEIPVLITYQPKSTELLSIWFDYSPYQGILTDTTEKKLKRLTDWKCFATTFGSGEIVVNNLKEKSINNASNRLPGGKNFSYLLDGKDINFVGDQMTINGEYSTNKKLIFRSQFTELIKNDEFDNYSNSLTSEFTVKKKYGKNYQDAFIESSISNIGFAIQDTNESISKYLGAACLVVDEEGSILLFIMGEIVKDPTIASIVKATHGDLFKLEKNPIIIPRND
ncbi:gp211 [Bacillus phage G]|uniref:Gp211 n=1 Tax=Bacillus phage G TaxID=2884420 RepID=G3MBS7_9CAUD|nr:gp211 [Bacillus phage G]AEO93470.1 gp211 [Bacillus phage G]